jgi:hypothetical protein
MANVTGTTSNMTATASNYLKELQEQLEEEVKEARQKAAKEKNRLEKNHAEQSQRLEKRFKGSTDDLRKEYEAAATREKENSRAELARLKSEVYAPVRKAVLSEHEAKAAATETIRQAEEQNREISSRKGAEVDNRTKRAHEAAIERSLKDAAALRNSHEREVSNLSKELTYAKNEYERDLAAQREYQERYSQHREAVGQEALQEMAENNAKKLRQTHSENNDREKALIENFSKEKANLNRARKEEKEHFTLQQEQLHQQRNQQFSKTETDRSEAFLDAMKRQSADSETEIDDLKSSLQSLKTSGDLRSFSPEAERNIREQLLNEYTEQSKTRENALDAKNQELLQRHKAKYSELRVDSERDKTRLKQDLAVAETRGKLALSRQAIESEFERDIVLDVKDSQYQRMAQNLERHYKQELENQRRNFEDRMESMTKEAQIKTDELRQEADFQLKLERRASAARQNELIRDYEGRLSDQRQEFAEELRAAKVATDKSILNLDQKHRQEMDQVTSQHERRLAGLEQQTQERERLSAKNHQEQLEKLKRAHALVLAKKG